MPTPAQNKTPVCEQCGAPLRSLAAEGGCLNCLLGSGIDGGGAAALPLPNESEPRVYQHYEILTHPDGSRWELGRGALGITYKARDVNLDTVVALKVINAHFSARPEARRRSLEEAQAAAQLRHPNVASVFHFGTLDDLSPAPAATPGAASERGDCFYAMEFVDGESLAARLVRTGPLRVELALEIALQVARALAAAEKRGLVHHDLKPSNIMLATDGSVAPAPDAPGRQEAVRVKVIGFGLARLAGDASSDIYSLGTILWSSLTGQRPGDRSAETPRSIEQLAGHDVPAPVSALLKSMLAPALENRPRSAVDLAAALQRCRDELSHATRVSRQRRRRWAVAGGLGLAATLLGVATYFALSSAPGDKSIAVLPFRNLSNDPANAFFAEGIQDDLLSRLFKIRDLRVIGRKSAANYPPEAQGDLREIGRTLGVRHVLEGSLRRTGDRVLLHVALVDTRDGHELWGERYDRSLADATNLQGELASSIAHALRARLSSRERMDVQSRPTRNADAYVLYLQGRKLENGPAIAIADQEAAQVLYSQAIALDPGFALAHARRASVLSFLYRNRGPGKDLKKLAHAEAHEALRLQPNLGEAHLANALCAYRIERDYERALPELEVARRLRPNDAEAESFVAFIRRRQGRWREARAGLERVAALDPRNMTYEEELYATCCLTRDWEGAARHAARAEAIAPTIPALKAERAMVELWKHGNLAPIHDALQHVSPASDPEGNVAWALWDMAMVSRDFAAAQKAIDSFPLETLPSVFGAPLPKSYLAGCIQLAQGRKARAQELLDDARPSMEAEVSAHPDDALRHARLGLLYAHLGRKADACREGERAVQLQPPSRDAYDGTEKACYLALIYARVGENDRAIAMIESLLRQPGGVSFYPASMSLSELRLRWQWDPLRSDPRFQKILEGPEPPTDY